MCGVKTFTKSMKGRGLVTACTLQTLVYTLSTFKTFLLRDHRPCVSFVVVVLLAFGACLLHTTHFYFVEQYGLHLTTSSYSSRISDSLTQVGTLHN